MANDGNSWRDWIVRAKSVLVGYEDAPKPNSEQCTPGALSAAATNATAAPADGVQAEFDEYRAFCKRYRVIPQSMEDGNFKDCGQLAQPGLQRRNIPTWFVPNVDGKPGKRQRVFTNMYEGISIVEVVMPGPETPVCSSMHFPSLLKEDVLLGLKESGVDAIVIVVPGPIDAANAWARRQLAAVNLAHLMPDSLPAEDIQARLELHPTMPRVLIQADPGLEKINELGLVKVIPGLGFAAERAFILYDKQGKLQDIVKAENPSAEKCSAVMGRAILELAQKHSTASRMRAMP